jgi:hypothetical protein
LWTHDGRHLGQFHGDEVYGPDGWYLGEIKGKDRLITNISKKGCRRGVFAQYAPRAAYARYANYVGYVIYAGSRTFPRPRCCNPPRKQTDSLIFKEKHPMPITIEKMNETTFKVTVADRTVTTHLVTVAPEYWQKLTGGTVSAEKLVEKSFEFLLDREPNTSILGAFDLPLIGRYFPEYEKTIRTLLK